MSHTPEQLDQLISQVKNHQDISAWQKDPTNSGNINLVAILANIPKAQAPKPNLEYARNKILDRISLPSDSRQKARTMFGWAWLNSLPRFVRLTGGAIAAFAIVLSVTVGTAAAALQSLPGQPIYPLKKIVENVQLQLASSDEQKTNLQIKFANARVDELETIIQKQKEGKATQEQVQKVVVETTKNLEATAKVVSDQNNGQPNVDMLAKIVTLTNKQSAIIQAAQVDSEGDVKIELEKALETTKISKEQAIENIERAGLVVDDNTLIIEEPQEKNEVSAEGKLTTVSTTAVSLGTSQFLLTKDTKYVNITSVDLKVGLAVEIVGHVVDKKTYALKIVGPVPLVETPVTPTEQPVGQTDPTAPIETLPVEPKTETPQ